MVKLSDHEHGECYNKVIQMTYRLDEYVSFRGVKALCCIYLCEYFVRER